MRITRRTASELQLEDSGFVLVAFGTLAIVIAIVAAGFAINAGKYAAAVVVVGGFAPAGLIMLRRAERAVHHFDLQRGILTIDTRPALAADGEGRKAVTYPLDTLADLVFEESPTPDRESGTHRPVYVFRDGSRLPLLPYYTTWSDRTELQVAVRSMLERAVDRPRGGRQTPGFTPRSAAAATG